ncbi:hypothetical protein Tco_1132067 [Tanacetum coccineum]|uniref:Uncharacterized protein n=1 Tax=Tanacetum coccineum TaxID=301880 RepID=A0ABQ5JAV6_9ASTR
MIPLGQKSTLTEYMILSGADNRPPMLDKDLYDSWKSRMELYMQNREHGRMILESVENGPLIWPTIKENGVTRTKKYVELSASCQRFMGESSITNVRGNYFKYYLRFTQLINDMNIYNMKIEQFQVNTKFLNSLPPEWSFAVPVFSLGDDLIACLNKAMAFLTDVASSRSRGSDGQAIQTIIPNNAAFQTGGLDTYDSDCDDISNAKAVLIANISNYASDVISVVPHSKTYLNVMENQSVHAMQDFEQSPVVDFSDNEIHSDRNIIPYSQYLQETQLKFVQDTTFQAQLDSMILSVIEQMSKQMINHVNN